AVVLEPQARAADVAAALVVAEPAADLHADAFDPFALGLRERLDLQVEREVLSRVAEAAEAVVAFADAAHHELKLADSARDEDRFERGVRPGEAQPLPLPAGVKAVVAREQIVLLLAARAARALAVCAERPLGVHAERERRQPRRDLLQMGIDRTALQDRPDRRRVRVLTVAGAEAVGVDA